MIHADSVLSLSRQTWKLYAMTLGVVIAGALMVVAQLNIESMSAERFAVVMLTGSCIALGSLLIAFAGIRCPTCRSRWLWQAATKQRSGNWLNWLSALKRCLPCGYGGPAI